MLRLEGVLDIKRGLSGQRRFRFTMNNKDRFGNKAKLFLELQKVL
jgi:hypothetical protein